jgi:hypothetical protein
MLFAACFVFRYSDFVLISGSVSLRHLVGGMVGIKFIDTYQATNQWVFNCA